MIRYTSAGDKGSDATFKINGTLASGTTNYSHYHQWSVETDGTFYQYKSGSSKNGAFAGAVHKTELSVGGIEIGDTSTDQIECQAFDLVTPTHTSSHYQTFETPFMNELVGGDRNMEQTNLVVTADGKTWDEVTRDTSYMGKTSLIVKTSTSSQLAVTAPCIPNTHRGLYVGIDMINKDWALAYNRWICLRDGHYTIHFNSLRSGSGNSEATGLYINGVKTLTFYSEVVNYRSTGALNASQYFSRGDYFAIHGWWWDSVHATLEVIRES